jgi:hypothetical protein
MKRIVSILLVLLMLVAFTACQKKTDDAKEGGVTGTWVGQIDVTDRVVQSLNALPALSGADVSKYMKDLKYDITLTLDENGTGTLEQNVRSMAGDFEECVRQLLEANPALLGGEDAAEQAHIASETLIQTFEAQVGTVTNSYTVDGNQLRMGKITGTVSGDKMTLSIPEMDDVTLTRK